MAEDPTPPHPPNGAKCGRSSKAQSAHDLQQRQVSQSGRMLEPEDSDIHDSGRHLHSGLPFLRDQNRPSPCSRRQEPRQVAESVALMETAVCRRNFRDTRRPPRRRSTHWAATVEAIRTQNPDAVIELLIPDLDARPDLGGGHRVEARHHRAQHRNRRATDPVVRSRAKYRTSLETLRCLSRQGVVTKSGLMVGLGESDDEVLQTLHDLRDAGVRIMTLGQYLRPTLEHYLVAAYITPKNSNGTDPGAGNGFQLLRERAAGPLVVHGRRGPAKRKKFVAMEVLAGTRNDGLQGVLICRVLVRRVGRPARSECPVPGTGTTWTMRARSCWWSIRRSHAGQKKQAPPKTCSWPAKRSKRWAHGPFHTTAAATSPSTAPGSWLCYPILDLERIGTG